MNIDEERVIGGMAGDFLQGLNNSIRDGIITGFATLFQYFVVLLFWFTKIGILACMLTYFCTGDRKSIIWAFKLGFIYLIIAIINKAGAL